MMVAALVRETMHDRVLMKSNFSRTRIICPDGSHENDAYYTLCYLNQGYDAKNNILWRFGVPLHGLKLSKSWSKKGRINRLEMYGIHTSCRLGEKQVPIWFSFYPAIVSDVDKPSGFIQIGEVSDYRNSSGSHEI